MAPRPVERTGLRYGRLTVIRMFDKVCGRPRWLCQCDCGNTNVATGANLTSGRSTSCGCLRTERVIAAKRVHGHGHPARRSPTYKSWRAMIDRCSLPKRHNWNNYGGKGIKVCARWQSFANFLADMGERPPGHTLDRIDSARDYEPSNCRWATQEQQSANRNFSAHV